MITTIITVIILNLLFTFLIKPTSFVDFILIGVLSGFLGSAYSAVINTALRVKKLEQYHQLEIKNENV